MENPSPCETGASWSSYPIPPELPWPIRVTEIGLPGWTFQCTVFLVKQKRVLNNLPECRCAVSGKESQHHCPGILNIPNHETVFRWMHVYSSKIEDESKRILPVNMFNDPTDDSDLFRVSLVSAWMRISPMPAIFESYANISKCAMLAAQKELAWACRGPLQSKML